MLARPGPVDGARESRGNNPAGAASSCNDPARGLPPRPDRLDAHRTQAETASQAYVRALPRRGLCGGAQDRAGQVPAEPAEQPCVQECVGRLCEGAGNVFGGLGWRWRCTCSLLLGTERGIGYPGQRFRGRSLPPAEHGEGVGIGLPLGNKSGPTWETHAQQARRFPPPMPRPACCVGVSLSRVGDV